EPAQACYAHISFSRADGSLIAERSVEFADPAPVSAPPASARLRRGKTVALEVRGATYEFDPATGLLVSASAKGRKLIHGVRPTIWRPLNPHERYIYVRRSIDPGKFPDLDKHTIRLKKWRATPGGIEAETEHVVDERNKFDVRWSYTPLADGSLKIAYAITPKVEVSWVPEAGLELKTDTAMDKLRWQGLGPLDSFANLKEAVMFGVWRLNAGDAAGVKSGVCWAELTTADSTGVRMQGSSYMRMAAPGTWRLLNAVEGRPSAKFQRAEKAEDHLDAIAGPKFSGSVTLRPMP
ncbi:MAG: hypothetical protein LLG20_09425, partial [Acidobacteriales bacterium]|nr:hypothetical protein [Terriglobales bacterium]